MAASKHEPLARVIADAIAKGLTDRPGVRLPTVSQLAEAHRVSRTTIVAAIKLLKDCGILAPGRGRRAVVAGAAPVPVSDTRNGMDRLVAGIGERISSGELRAGEKIPKLSVYVREYRVSLTTVTRALAQLRAAEVVHKEGRSWVVGRRQEGLRLHLHVLDRPAIMVLIPHETKWRSLYSGRTGPFCRAFDDQAQRHQVQVRFGLLSSSASNKAGLAAGMAGIEALIRELGGRYRGTLIAGVGASQAIDDHGMTLPGLVERLRKYKRPVVWFDPHNEPGGTAALGRPFYRAHFLEPAGVEAALEHLFLAGHTLAGCPILRGDWQPARQKLIGECAGQTKRSPRVVAPPLQESTLGDSSIDELAQGLLRLRSSGIAPFRDWIGDRMHEHEGESDPYHALAKRLRENAPVGAWRFLLEAGSLAACLRVPGLTALIAPNDLHAGHIWEWLTRAGVRVPRDVSLVSFDNYETLHPLPLDSVDFGFGYLGYSAFHAIHEVVPVRAKRNGDIPARARVVVRGSVGRPSGRRNWRRFLGETE